MNPQLPSREVWLLNGIASGTLRQYPIASPRTFTSFSAELITLFPIGVPAGPFIVPAGGTVEFQLFHNSIAVPSFLIVYVAGEGGIKSAIAPVPEVFVVGDTFTVRCLTTGFDLPINQNGQFSCSATIGIL